MSALGGRGDRPRAKRLSWMRRVLSATDSSAGHVVLAVAASIVTAGVAVAVPVVERQIVDNVMLRRRSPLAPWLLLLVACGAVSFVASRVRRMRAARLALGSQIELRNLVFEQMQRLGSLGDSSTSAAQVVSRVSSDLRLLMRFMSFLPAGISAVMLTLGALAMMLVYSPLLAVVSLSAVPLLAVVGYWTRRGMYAMTWDAQQRWAELFQVILQGVRGARVVRAFGCEQREMDRLVAANRSLFGSNLRVVRYQARYQAVLNAIPSLCQVAVLALGGWLALKGRLTVGTYLAFATYVVAIVAPVRFLASLMLMGQQARVGAERVFDILDSVPAVADRPGALALEHPRGEVRFEGVRFAYSSESPALDGFDLRLPAGSTTALVGPSGSGKSTVVTLLARLADAQGGTVRVDGVDVRDLRIASLRRQVGVVFEDPFLFSGTIRDNVAFGRPDATDEEVEAAARAAGAHDFVSRLPEGYLTDLGERGFTLSGGQRQRLTIARAILGQPAILVLDDATSAVDVGNERRIHESLRRLMAHRTTLVVAHRRSTLQLADRIVVMDKGRVVDAGSHDELFERCPLYRKLSAGEADLLDEALAAPAADAADEAPVGLPEPPPNPSLVPLSPQLLARVAALRPVTDDPRVDLEAAARDDGAFRFRSVLRPYVPALLLSFLLVAVDTVLTVLGPFLGRQGIDNGVLRGSSAALFTAAAIFAATAVLDLGVMALGTVVVGRTGLRLMLALRVKIWAQLQRLSVDFYDRERAGQIVTRLTSDLSALYAVVQDAFVSSGLNVLTIVGVLVAMAVVDMRLAAAMIPVLVTAVVATVVFRRVSAGPYRESRERLGVLNSDLQENLAGVRESVSFGQQERRSANFRRYSDEYLTARVRTQSIAATYFPFLDLLSDVASAAVMWVGYVLVTRGEIQIGTVIAFLLYVDMLFNPIQQLSTLVDDWQEADVSRRRVSELLAERTLTPAPERPRVPAAVRGEISFEEVGFAYPGTTRPALAGVDLQIRAGETLAVVGPTGAGKSTLAKLLVRLYDPTAGRVLLDGIDLRELDPAVLRRHVAFVPQESFLFPGTVAANIGYAREGSTLSDVKRAAARAGVHRFLTELPGGYECMIGDGSVGLSSGQRQLIALARAELVEPRVLVLDEATSNLDQATEAVVGAALRSMAGSRTTVIVAHRLQTAALGDRVVEVQQGEVAETLPFADAAAGGLSS